MEKKPDLELDVTMIAMHKAYGEDAMVKWCINESGKFPGGQPEVLAHMKWFLQQPMEYQELAIAQANDSVRPLAGGKSSGGIIVP